MRVKAGSHRASEWMTFMLCHQTKHRFYCHLLVVFFFKYCFMCIFAFIRFKLCPEAVTAAASVFLGTSCQMMMVVVVVVPTRPFCGLKMRQLFGSRNSYSVCVYSAKQCRWVDLWHYIYKVVVGGDKRGVLLMHGWTGVVLWSRR